ncbi:SCO4225 family membrane protein [Streptomyces sp. NPDC102437]|uniref:SCO4225 family membrane protein n=1 Tax=Streptomyces sp. NPDC102437 TaxID=3366175 RepID=UPI0038037F22
MSARTLLRLTFANAASAVYLGLVGASVVFEVAAALSEDPGIVGIWTFLLTAPASLLAAGAVESVWGLEASYWYLVGGVVISALVQSFALGALLAALRGRRQGNPRPSRG